MEQPSAMEDVIFQIQGLTVNDKTIRTRSGRVVKKPDRYSPQEICDDDYAAEDYDSHESSDVSSEVSYDSEDVSSESDADEDGNLRDFVVEDKSSSEVEDSDDGSDVRSVSSETDVPPRGKSTPTGNGGRGRGRRTTPKQIL